MSVVNLMFIHVFFFKHKTSYDMRISDWSSDVCSSDLGVHALHRQRERTPEAGIRGRLVRKGADHALAAGAEHDRAAEAVAQRKAVEEREIVGKAFAETDAGIGDDLRAIDACCAPAVSPRLEPPDTPGKQTGHAPP